MRQHSLSTRAEARAHFFARDFCVDGDMAALPAISEIESSDQLSETKANQGTSHTPKPIKALQESNLCTPILGL